MSLPYLGIFCFWRKNRVPWFGFYHDNPFYTPEKICWFWKELMWWWAPSYSLGVYLKYGVWPPLVTKLSKPHVLWGHSLGFIAGIAQQHEIGIWIFEVFEVVI